MIIYWPHKQGVNLNSEVANLFFYTRQKFSNNLINHTSYNLYIDILDNSVRGQLFSIVLTELEILILDIVELDLSIQNIKLLNCKILYDLVQQSLKHFLLKLDDSADIAVKYKSRNYLDLILSDHKITLEYLLIYVIFGSSFISKQSFVFDELYTPREHVAVLLENLVIQISDLVVFTIFDNMQSLAKISSFIQKNSLCNTSYLSIRSLALFRNNLVIQKIIYLYIQKPKEIYSSRYKIWLISNKGLVCKYISVLRLEDLSKLSNIQLILVLFIEIQDILIPQIEKLLLIFSKVILYIFINFLGNSIIFCIRTILSGIHSINK